MTPEDVAQGVVVLLIFTMLLMVTVGAVVKVGRDFVMSTAPEQAAPTVHVVCTADGVILWEGDAARADYDDGQWTVCATSAPCRLSTSKVRTSAACVVTPLVEAEP